MKLLFDENLSAELCSRVTDLFAGSSQVRLMGLAQASDSVIWERAKTGGFVIVSLDADFADMAALYGAPPKVIWLRCGNTSNARLKEILMASFPSARTMLEGTESLVEITAT